MLTLEQEIELLLSIISSIEDDDQHAVISMKLLELNELMKIRK